MSSNFEQPSRISIKSKSNTSLFYFKFLFIQMYSNTLWLSNIIRSIGQKLQTTFKKSQLKSKPRTLHLISPRNRTSYPFVRSFTAYFPFSRRGEVEGGVVDSRLTRAHRQRTKGVTESQGTMPLLPPFPIRTPDIPELIISVLWQRMKGVEGGSWNVETRKECGGRG